jgi:predicted RNA-binding Zn-ribbon protein involved in translation (DUF1610 family)
LSETPRNVKVGDDLSDCPRCGAGRGFHVSFRRKERTLSVILVCPSCGFRFTVGEWAFPTGEPRPFDPAIDSGP